MNTKELDFIDHLIRSTDNDNIVIISEEREITLKDQFGVCGKHAHQITVPGFYVYGNVDWQIFGDYEPSVMYLLSDCDNKLFYFPPVF